MSGQKIPALPMMLLSAGCFGVFAASCSGSTRAPFLIDMAGDLAVSVPLVANLVAMTSIAWGTASLAAGAGSDRWGRRPFLIGGPLALAVSMAGVALSSTICRTGASVPRYTRARLAAASRLMESAAFPASLTVGMALSVFTPAPGPAGIGAGAGARSISRSIRAV